MNSDPIVDELHRQRAEAMKLFEYDFDAYCRQLREHEKRSSEPTVPPPDSAPKTTVQRTRAARR